MAQYDPQRSRSRHRNGEDEGPAPVDALLGPAEPPAEPPAPATTEPPGLIDLTDSAPPATGAAPTANGSTPAPDVSGSAGGPPAPGPVRPLLVALALVAALALVWAWLRRRRTPPEPD